ncbi:hypothetical protein PNOK_0655400 [Pyrrhoderma noxium]|uniref:Uncharacterized protein n=1 Tax=Pyrrhoderma noxium TaxID=2282107 RepID=A0A286UET8_9AGAM|nr:hypothetical protein PNOK_0655400 [Pyrrhoderma noxium]
MEKYYIPENAMDAQNDEKKILLDFQLLKYIFFSISSFIIYQHILTCNYSFDYFWRKPREMAFWNCICLANRHVPIVTILILAFPLFVPITHFKSCAVIIIILQLILTHRLCLVWRDNKIIVACSCLNLVILTLASVAMFAGAYIKNGGYTIYSYASLINCLGVESLNWVPLPLFAATEVVCLVLLGFKRIKEAREENGLLRSALYRALVDDGLMYYSYSIILALVDSVLFFYLQNRIIALAIAIIDSMLHNLTNYEIKHLWDTRISFWNLVYLANRYSPLGQCLAFFLMLYLPPKYFKTCSYPILIYEFSVGCNIYLATIILNQRFFAIWKENKIVVVSSCIFVILLSISGITIFAVSTNDGKGKPSSGIISIIDCARFDTLNWTPLIIFVAGETGITYLRTIRGGKGAHTYSILFRTLINDG